MSEFGPLEAAEFDVLLDLLGEALSLKVAPGESVVAFSSDGTLRIRLEPVNPPAPAVVHTADGAFRGDDHLVTITPAFDEVPTDALALANGELTP